MLLTHWPPAPGAGVSGVVLGLCEAMRDRYRPVVLVNWNAPTSADQLRVKLPPPTRRFRDALGFVAHFLPNIVHLRRITREAVAINPHYAGLEILPLILLRQVGLCPKLILSVHGADLDEPKAASGLKRILYAWMFSAADLVVACSHALASIVREVSPRANVVAVWNGVGQPPSRIDERPMEAPYLVCVAAFTKKKAHDILIPAFRQVIEKLRDLRLVLIGNEGPERSTIVSLLHTLGLVDKVDIMVNLPHSEVWRWLHHADCFVLPSRQEPFGIAVLEAGMARTPVVATRVGGIPEFVVDGIHGLLCEPDNSEQIASAVLETLGDLVPTAARVEAFYQHAQTFTWGRAFERYRKEAGLP